MALHVEEEPVVQLAVNAPRMPGLHPFELAAGQADAPQAVVLEVVADLHREDHSEAQDEVNAKRPRAAHPPDEPPPEGDFDRVAPEGIGVVPHGQAAAREPAPLDPPGSGEVARHLPREVMPEALTLRGGAHVPRGADESVVDVDVLGDVVRVGDRRQQKLAEAAFPHREPMDHLVAGDEDRLGHHGKHRRHQGDLPGDEVSGDEHLPEGEHERHRPEKRPHPHREHVPEQPPLGSALGIHVPLVRTEPGVEHARARVEDQRKRNPPAAVDRGVDHQGKDGQREEVRERVAQRRLDRSRRGGSRSARIGHTLRHDAPRRVPACLNSSGRRLSPACRFR